jgi:hypothetical protein
MDRFFGKPKTAEEAEANEGKTIVYAVTPDKIPTLDEIREMARKKADA